MSLSSFRRWMSSALGALSAGRYRWISFLLIVVLLSLGMALGVIVSRNAIGGEMTATEERVVLACLTLAVVAVGFARQEYLQRKNTESQKAISAEAHEAAIAAAAAAAEAKRANEELPERVVQRINGGIDRVVAEKLNASPFPTTPEQLDEFIQAALDRAVKRGWQPPEGPGRVQT